MKELLVVVDMQNDFVSGTLGSAAAAAVVPDVERLIRHKRRAGAQVVFTLDTHGEDYPNTQEGKLLPVGHCVKGTEGWKIVPELLPFTEGARLFEKPVFGSIALAEFVKNERFDEVTLCGVCTDICMVSNALLLKAYCPDTVVRVVAEACAGTSEEAHAAALATMKSCQVIVE